MTGAQLLKRANARTYAAFLREGMEVPLEAATTLGDAWPVLKHELASYGLRLEWVGPVFVVREGAPVEIAANDVEPLR